MGLITLALAGPLPAGARQFETPPGEEPAETSPAEAPTQESILAAHRAGTGSAEIIAWIEGSDVAFDLSLEDVMRLRTAGLPPEVIAAMARIPEERLRRVLADREPSPAAPAERRQGLSRRRLLKMVRSGASEEEILAAIAAEGSRASLRLDEAFELLDKGFSTALLRAIVTGVAPEGAPAAAARAPDRPVPSPNAAEATRAASPGGRAGPATAPAAAPATTSDEEEAPLLDELLGEEEEEPFLDELLGEEETPEGGAAEEEEPLLDELAPLEGAEEEAGEARFLVLTDQPGARVLVAPASTRIADLLRQARSVGRTPARLSLPAGSHYLLVEKKPDEFDRALIPALRTVHDGDGRTRTLITSGDLSYDVRLCCVPRSLSGDLAITRISEDQQGVLLGDEFGGMPPYLWDGDRYQILVVRDARVQRVLKVYEIRRAIGESGAFTATFIPSSVDPLAVAARAPEGSNVEGSGAAWVAPATEDLQGLGRIYGIPEEDLERIEPILAAAGKAIWRQEAPDGSLRLLALSLDSDGRTRAHESLFRRDGPFGALSTPAPPAPKKKRASKKAAPSPPPAPLGPVSRIVDPAVNLPVLSIENGADSDAMVRLSDGTVVFVPAGETREITVSPGSSEVEARFEDQPEIRRTVKAHLTYHARYRIRLD